jgi:hypothetical protein
LFFVFFNFQGLNFSNQYTVWKNITGEVVFFWLLMNSDPKNKIKQRPKNLRSKIKLENFRLRPRNTDPQKLQIGNKIARYNKLNLLFLATSVWISEREKTSNKNYHFTHRRDSDLVFFLFFYFSKWLAVLAFLDQIDREKQKLGKIVKFHSNKFFPKNKHIGQKLAIVCQQKFIF